VLLANLSFGEQLIALSKTSRSGSGLLVSELIGTFALVFLILVLVRTDRAQLVPAAVGAWVGAIIYATSSTGFANPAVTFSRIFTDTYTGIEPSSAAPFLAVQLVAGLLAVPVVRLLFPTRQPSHANA
jgi:glycerol uptake facilitator-like aquaporin